MGSSCETGEVGAANIMPNLVDSKVCMATNYMTSFENSALEVISYPLPKHHAPQNNVRKANEAYSEIDQSARN
jgi:hypothetical protein